MSSVKIDGIAELMQELESLGSKANQAMADALNHTANQARIALRQSMSDSFTNPTNFTLNAIRVINAKKADPESAVFVKDDKGKGGQGFAAAEWFAPQVFGGERFSKKSEIGLRKAGILPADMYIVPAAGAKLDRFGNMNGRYVKKIMDGLIKSRSQKPDPKSKDVVYFVIRKGTRPIGIGERVGKSSKMVIAFVRKPNYAPRLDFFGVVSEVANQNLENNLDLAISKML
ncbi:hypothetical protein VQ643_09555 [Pseudomonas sp. F1_0610]|uniref:hypothetical protein n=1 Tax=Pseudomonas sp. F1_0610 TaxID=3114284 RepID=UPI0039C07A19